MSGERISIAIPTGVLTGGALNLLDHSGLVKLSAEELGRQLLVERSGLRVILVRPTDVPAYVDHGAADLGIVGKDILWETPGAHYELVDLRFGDCRLVLPSGEEQKAKSAEEHSEHQVRTPAKVTDVVGLAGDEEHQHPEQHRDGDAVGDALEHH